MGLESQCLTWSDSGLLSEFFIRSIKRSHFEIYSIQLINRVLFISTTELIYKLCLKTEYLQYIKNCFFVLLNIDSKD